MKFGELRNIRGYYYTRLDEDRYLRYNTALYTFYFSKAKTPFDFDIVFTAPEGYRPLMPGEVFRDGCRFFHFETGRLESEGETFLPRPIPQSLSIFKANLEHKISWVVPIKPKKTLMNPWSFKQKVKIPEGYEEVGFAWWDKLHRQATVGQLGSLLVLDLKEQPEDPRPVSCIIYSPTAPRNDPDRFILLVPDWVYKHGRLPETRLERIRCGVQEDPYENHNH